VAFLSWFGAFFRCRHDLGLELVALRQQVGVLKRKNPRPQLEALRSTLLAEPSTFLVEMGERVGDRETGDRRRLASRQFPPLLATGLAPPFWPAENHPPSFAVSFDPWRQRIPPGEFPGSTVSC
jgi:hypothetical protein